MPLLVLVLPNSHNLLGWGDIVPRLQWKGFLELEMRLHLLRLSPEAKSSAHDDSSKISSGPVKHSSGISFDFVYGLLNDHSRSARCGEMEKARAVLPWP
jgi:hypothetical protein